MPLCAAVQVEHEEERGRELTETIEGAAVVLLWLQCMRIVLLAGRPTGNGLMCSRAQLMQIAFPYSKQPCRDARIQWLSLRFAKRPSGLASPASYALTDICRADRGAC